MKAAIQKNFRGMRALVVHCDDINRRVLLSVLGKLGLKADARDPQDANLQAALADCDIVFFDADVPIEPLFLNNSPLNQPSIALIGSEAPSHLARIVGQRCCSHILKPIRNTGVFTAVLLAVNEHEQKQKAEREIETLRQRLAGRRIVTMAVLDIMTAYGLDQDEAYERLRVTAMNRRISIDMLAREYLAPDVRAQGPHRLPGAKADDCHKKHALNRRLSQ